MSTRPSLSPLGGIAPPAREPLDEGRRMKLRWFHLMPYTALPDDFMGGLEYAADAVGDEIVRFLDNGGR